jgi:hypothetical protein
VVPEHAAQFDAALEGRMGQSAKWRMAAYDRKNLRGASGSINSRTFEAFGLFDKMFPRIPSVGLLLEF